MARSPKVQHEKHIKISKLGRQEVYRFRLTLVPEEQKKILETSEKLGLDLAQTMYLMTRVYYLKMNERRNGKLKHDFQEVQCPEPFYITRKDKEIISRIIDGGQCHNICKDTSFSKDPGCSAKWCNAEIHYLRYIIDEVLKQRRTEKTRVFDFENTNQCVSFEINPDNEECLQVLCLFMRRNISDVIHRVIKDFDYKEELNKSIKRVVRYNGEKSEAKINE